MNESTPKRIPFAPLQCRVLDTSKISSSYLTNSCHLSPFEGKEKRRKRAKEFGLTPPPLDPFLHNQSLPCVHESPENGNVSLDMGESRKCSIDKFQGDTLGSISFSPTKLSPHQEIESQSNRHLNGSSLYCKNAEESAGNSSPVQNPNKAIVTINARTTEILTANKFAFHLLGIRGEDSPSRLSDFIFSPEEQDLFSEAGLKPNRDLVLFSGKVMDLITSSKETVPVSVWARQLSSEGDYRFLVVMEPIERIAGTVKFNCLGRVVECGTSFASLFGCTDPQHLIGKPLAQYIPLIGINAETPYDPKRHKEGVRQNLTGKASDGFMFPLSIQIKPHLMIEEKDIDTGDNVMDRTVYEGVVWVFNNISGLITLLPDGTIYSCNTNFTLILFGYTSTHLQWKNITYLIPSFYDDIEFLDTDSMALPLFDDDDDSNAKYGTSDGRTTADSMGIDLPRPMNPMGRSAEPKDEVEYFVYTPFEDQSPTFSLPSTSNQLSPGSHSSKFLDSGEVKMLDFSPDLEDKACDVLKTEEISASSAQGSSSRHLTYSESQDTLHSCTNSITESDINANYFASAENQECQGDPTASKVPGCVDEQNDCDSDIFNSESSNCEESEASNCEESEASNLEESESSNLGGNDSSNEGKNYALCPEDVQQDVAFSPPSNITTPDTTSKTCQNRYSRSASECGLSSRTVPAKSSTPKEQNINPPSDNSCQSIPEGEFIGIGRHKDGTDLAIEYYIKKVVLNTGKPLYCLWISRDPDEIKEHSPVAKAHQSKSFHATQTESELSSSAESESSDSSMLSDSVYIEGDFSKNYTILYHMGKGGFGCIKKAYRNTDGLVVIAKFIQKSEVYKDSWVYDNKFKTKVPLEVSILTSIEHPNIVKVLDVFESSICIQMVMERHGSGMDLFEFIERSPWMDEPLASYIFRQIIAALSYLHGLSILHRDIKDENVIINEKFQVKLIDLGSAAYMEQDKLFSTFCGTTEYCSPEVIRGNKYRGPELEMFALGVTLYTLMFGENPFVGADEILKGEYDLPPKISLDLHFLIKRLLNPDPLKRCTLAEAEKHCWVNQYVDIENYNFSSVVDAKDWEMHPSKYTKLPRTDPREPDLESNRESDLENSQEPDLESSHEPDSERSHRPDLDEQDLESSHEIDSDVSCLETKLASFDLGSRSRSLTESEVDSLS